MLADKRFSTKEDIVVCLKIPSGNADTGGDKQEQAWSRSSAFHNNLTKPFLPNQVGQTKKTNNILAEKASRIMQFFV